MGQKSRRSGTSARIESQRLAVSFTLNNFSVGFQAVLSSWPVPVIWMVDLVLAPEAYGFFNERLFHFVRQLPPLLSKDFANLGVAHFWVISVHLSSSFLGPYHKGVQRPLNVTIVMYWQSEFHNLGFLVVHTVRWTGSEWGIWQTY